MAQVLCAGCNKQVTLNGLASHIRKTQNVRCRTARNVLPAPGSNPGATTSLASFSGAVSSFGPDQFLEFGASQWRHTESEFSMHTQEGKLTVTHFKGSIVADSLYVSGLPDDILSGEHSMLRPTQ